VSAEHGRHLVSFGAEYWTTPETTREEFVAAMCLGMRHMKWVRDRTQRGRETRGPTPRYRGRNTGHPWASPVPLERARPPFAAITPAVLQQR
jgi:hypothetical protein